MLNVQTINCMQYSEPAVMQSRSQSRNETNTHKENLVQKHPGGGGYSHTLPIRVCAAQRGRDFEAPDLERGIHFRGVF